MSKIAVVAKQMAVAPAPRQHNWQLAKSLNHQTAGPGAHTSLRPLSVRAATCQTAFARC
ncbi:hypothetical protein [Aquitalea denitrificans]|uniref:hypothetical protein n=1 Tax=Aquitalea denitrificans TaxID=519081 RepID=UPI001357EECA|nr:hypothetical protein [Aquitalea denitrificans]